MKLFLMMLGDLTSEYQLELPYLPTPEEVAIEMLLLAGAYPGEKVVDLGAGTGEILITANKLFGCIAEGYEINKTLAKKAIENANKSAAKIRVYTKDLFEADISDADIITIFARGKVLNLIKQFVFKNAKEGCRVICHDYPLPGVDPIAIAKVNGTKYHKHIIYMYIVPKRA